MKKQPAPLTDGTASTDPLTRRKFLATAALGGAAMLTPRSLSGATAADSAKITVNSGYRRPFTVEELGLEVPDEVIIGGKAFKPAAPPRGFRHDRELGIIVHESVALQRLHAQPPTGNFTEPVRAIRTPGGDFLALMPSGSGHMINNKSKVNELVAYRSSDRGRTWEGPTSPWWVPYNQHGFNPLIPRGGKRIVAFGTEPRPDLFVPPHDGGIGMRTSDDDGHTWSQPTILRPVNDPDYRGVGHMQGCETDAGTWLIPTHSVHYAPGGWPNREDYQYVLRSEDKGRTWTLLPGPRPKGWAVAPYKRMLEGQIINLGGGRAVLFSRVPSGRIWEMRSADDGKTWSEPKPTALVHPDAPPMIFKLADAKTLVAFIHNQPASRRDSQNNAYLQGDRRELWVSLSRDDGLTWSEPRFLLADACKPDPTRHWLEVSYCDLIVTGNELHLFFDHQKRQILYARFTEADLNRLPTRAELG